MCGRYTLQVSNRPTLSTLGLPLADRFNIAPQSPVLVINPAGDYEIKPWDYSPVWAREPMHLTNARSETLREKPAFRKADRCVFVADGWYEWQRRGDYKQPWYHHRGGDLFYMAGVYQPGVGCAVVTQGATAPLAKVHHRQPVLLDEQCLDAWLNGTQSFEELPTLEVSLHPVSSRVGNVRYDDSELIVPVDVDEPAAGQTADLFS